MSVVVAGAKRLVVKVGSSLVTNEGRGLDHAAVARWAEEIAALQARRPRGRAGVVGRDRRGHQAPRLDDAARARSTSCRRRRPSARWASCRRTRSAFAQFGLHTAQILLTHDDLADRRRYLNARTTLRTLLALGVIPIINENDTVTTDEIRVGDNDTLGALVANLIEADVLVLLTDQPGLYTADPRKRPDGDAGARGARRRPGARGDGRRRRQRARHAAAC